MTSSDHRSHRRSCFGWRVLLASNAFYGFSLAIIGPEVIEVFRSNVRFSENFGKFCFFWPLEASILTWAKKWLKRFRNGFWRAIERFFPFSSTMRRSRVSRGRRDAPPPGAAKVAPSTGAARVKWQEDWDSTNDKLKSIKPRLASWFSSMRTSRRDEVQLRRLRIGHTLATHRYLLCGDSRPRCSLCGENLTVVHVLVSCRHLSSERLRVFGSTSLSLKDLADGSDHIPQVFHFLENLKFSVIFSRVT